MALKKLPGHLRAASGLEWVILKKLPGVFLGGLALLALLTWMFHQWPPAGSEHEVAKKLLNIDIFAIGLAVVHITAVGTVALGCVVVMIMKGPAYVADGIPLVDADSPEEADEALRQAAKRENDDPAGAGDGSAPVAGSRTEDSGNNKR